MWHTTSAQVVAAPGGVIRQGDGTREHCGIEPGSPNRTAELEHVDAELQLLDAAAEVVEQYAQHPVADIAHVAGQQLIGQANTCCGGLKLLPHKVDIGIARIWRVGEFDLFALHQLLHAAGLKSDQGRPIAVGLDGLTGYRVKNRLAITGRFDDEAREQVGDLLPEQDCIVVVVQGLEAQQHRRQTRNTAQLTRLGRLEDMQHLAGRNSVQGVVGIAVGQGIAGMRGVHPVSNALADSVELDPSTDDVAATGL